MGKLLILGTVGLALAGCASAGSRGYIRADGRPADALQTRAMLAQCKGEGATAVVDYVGGEGAIPWAVGLGSRSAKESAVVDACMARNGYVAP
jgi:hypothetical protein